MNTITFRKKIRRKLKRERIVYKDKKQEREEEQKIALQKKIRRQLYANASRNRKLEKEVIMKKVCKRYPRKKKYLGLSQVNYYLF